MEASESLSFAPGFKPVEWFRDKISSIKRVEPSPPTKISTLPKEITSSHIGTISTPTETPSTDIISSLKEATAIEDVSQPIDETYFRNLSSKLGIEVNDLTRQEKVLMMTFSKSYMESGSTSEEFELVNIIRRGKIESSSELSCEYRNRYDFHATGVSESANSVAVSILAIREAQSLGLSSEVLGSRLDAFLAILHSRCVLMDLDRNQIAGLATVLEQLKDENPAGLDKSIRKDLILQSIQFMSLKSLTYTDVLSGNRDTRGRGAKLKYPEDVDEKVLKEIDEKMSPEDVFVRIMALTAPYKASLGKSTLGSENLEVFKRMLESTKDKLKFIPEGSPMRQLAEETVLTQMLHVYGVNSFESHLGGFSDTTVENIRGYVEYRKSHPLWEDKLSIYKKLWGDQKGEEEPIVPKLRVGISTGMGIALKVLQSGDYISLHEAFNGNGCTDLGVRSRGEQRLHLLSTGTPDDPYLIYGAMRKMTREGFIDVHYGGFTFILKQDCYNRSSVCISDSLGGDYLVYADREKFSEFANHYDNEYAEVQVHGGWKVEDVESLVVEKECLADELCEHIIELCRQKGIKVVVREEMEPETDAR